MRPDSAGQPGEAADPGRSPRATRPGSGGDALVAAACASAGAVHAAGHTPAGSDGGRTMVPLFVCHANASRSMVAAYLYEHLCGAPALSAGVYAGELPAPRSVALLAHWGIDASAHRPTQLTRSLCDQADALFVMGALYARRILVDYGGDLAGKTYLFADPFTRPAALGDGQYMVNDPGFDARPTWQIVPDYAWMRERVLAIRLALLGRGPRRLVPAADYLDVLSSVEPV